MIVAEQLYKIRNAKYCKENESKYTHRPFEPFKSKMLSNKVAERWTLNILPDQGKKIFRNYGKQCPAH